MCHKQLVLLTAIFFNLFFGFSQTKETDSLTIQLAYQDQTTLKVDTSIALIKILIQQEEFSKALQFINKSTQLAKALNYTKGIAELHYYKAQISTVNKAYHSAFEDFKMALEYYSKSQDSLGIAKVNNAVGLIQIKNGNYAEGLKYSLS